MPAKKRDESKQALLRADTTESPPPSVDGDSEDESAGLVGGEKKQSAVRAYEKPSSDSFTLRWPGRRGLCISLLVLLAIVGAIAGSAYFVYQIDPPTGQSPPYASRVSNAPWRHAQFMGRKLPKSCGSGAEDGLDGEGQYHDRRRMVRKLLCTYMKQSLIAQGATTSASATLAPPSMRVSLRCVSRTGLSAYALRTTSLLSLPASLLQRHGTGT
ncbi:MAG: hypothetical protein LQ340_007181 [Diploschistes diacapsis]|nr:MAG: hypothetical protein LQ340_007181 [Diploschistes diacapsis]